MASVSVSNKFTCRGLKASRVIDGKGRHSWRVDARKLHYVPKRERYRSFAKKADAKRHMEWLAELRDSPISEILPFDEAVGLRFIRIQLEEQIPPNTPTPTVVKLAQMGSDLYLRELTTKSDTTIAEAVSHYCNERERLKEAEAKQLAEERSQLERLAASFEGVTLKNLGEGDQHGEITGAKRLRDWIANQTSKKNGEKLAARGRNKLAKLIHKFWQWCCGTWIGLDPNVTLGLTKKFRVTASPNAETFEIEAVKALFETAVHEETHQSLIPYLAMVFFTGRRPSEIADPNDRRRRMDWKNCFSWEEPCSITGGKCFVVPSLKEVNGKLIRAAKSRYDTTGLIHPTGLKWLQFFFLNLKGTSLPIQGAIDFTKARLNKLIKESGVEWIQDGPRHTFATAMHKIYPQHSETIVRRMAHSQHVYETHYRDSRFTHKMAEEYFAILPPHGTAQLGA